jgi:hypothetical protein
LSAKAYGESKTRIVHNTLKNGDVYILERKTMYDVDKKWNKALSAKLLSKIPKGSKIPARTRSKKPHLDKEAKLTKEITASRDHVGMMELIDHLGSASGIDDGLYSNADLGAARKIISIARYPLAPEGQNQPGILTWRFNHPLPYEDGMTEDVCRDLFSRVGRDESPRQGFFANRRASVKNRDVLAAAFRAATSPPSSGAFGDPRSLSLARPSAAGSWRDFVEALKPKSRPDAVLFRRAPRLPWRVAKSRFWRAGTPPRDATSLLKASSGKAHPG